MKLSVIIPCFNAARTIEDVFRTLLEQSWPDEWEVIVADNGSTGLQAGDGRREEK